MILLDSIDNNYMGSAPTVSKSTQTDGKYHVPPSLSQAYASITSALENPQKSSPTKKKQKSSDLMLMI